MLRAAGQDADGHPVDDSGAPLIERAGAKISVLERVLENWGNRLRTLPPGTKTEHYMRQEMAAVRAAIAALKFHRAEIEGADTVKLAAAELQDALDSVFRESAEATTATEWGRVQAARERLRKLLAEE